MIAGVDASVVFDREALTAKLAVDAELRRKAQMLGHERFEMIDEHSA